jgi:hypothetical protein
MALTIIYQKHQELARQVRCLELNAFIMYQCRIL